MLKSSTLIAVRAFRSEDTLQSSLISWFLRSAFSILSLTVGCIPDSDESGFPPITVVSFETLAATEAEIRSRLPPGPGEYENWVRLHEDLEVVLLEYGSVSSEPDANPDFYVTGDWFDETQDGVSINSPKPLLRQLLQRLPGVLASHHRDARFGIYGTDGQVAGLEILVTSTEIWIGWDGLSAEQCKKRLCEIGVDFEPE